MNGRSMADKTGNLPEIIQRVADNMLATRPKKEVVYRPYSKHEGISYQNAWGWVKLDLQKFYPGAKIGDAAYATTLLHAQDDREIYLCVDGNVEVYFEDECVFSYQDPKDCQRHDDPLGGGSLYLVPVTVKKGYQKVCIRCTCGDNGFFLKFVPTLRYFPGMWARDYLFALRTTMPMEECKGEEGFAVSTERNPARYDFPVVGGKREQVDFTRHYAPEKGGTAYGLTYCKTGGAFSVVSDCPVLALVNDRYVDPKWFSAEEGDRILVKCGAKDGKWSFALDGDRTHLPFVTSSRGNSDWLLLGEFPDAMNIRYGPEHGISFKRIYTNSAGQQVFWRLDDPDTYLRPYLDTTFYGQWFYALMVGHIGLLQAAKALDNRAYSDYFCSSISLLADYYDYMRFEREFYGCSSFLQRAADSDLDNTGTMGMNLIESFLLTNNREILPVLDRLSDNALRRVPRFKDGTFHRASTMWADDLYMSCPFLVRMGNLTGDSRYYDECYRQICGFKEKLYIEEEHIFSHIYFLDTQLANRVPWGRGNGWVMVAITEVLERLPEGYGHKTHIIEILRAFAQGVVKLMDDSGLWHQVLNRKESYLETSATAMFVLSLARGVNNGWLGAEFVPYIKKGFEGLTTRAIDEHGNVYGVCKGSGCSMEPEYYFNLLPVDNDDHGTGIILLAACEVRFI